MDSGPSGPCHNFHARLIATRLLEQRGALESLKTLKQPEIEGMFETFESFYIVSTAATGSSEHVDGGGSGTEIEVMEGSKIWVVCASDEKRTPRELLVLGKGNRM